MFNVPALRQEADRLGSSAEVDSMAGLNAATIASVSTFCSTSTEARWLVREEGDERVKARPRIPPEKDRRDRGPPPEQWKC